MRTILGCFRILMGRKHQGGCNVSHLMKDEKTTKMQSIFSAIFIIIFILSIKNDTVIFFE